jgi:hypothetical protein
VLNVEHIHKVIFIILAIFINFGKNLYKTFIQQSMDAIQTF